MSLFSGKKILLGISGGIAAYKTPMLVRAFIKQGAEVRVIMTPSSKDFVTPLSLATVSQNPVYSSFIAEDQDNPLWNNHVEMALWADYMLIAPATSNTYSFHGASPLYQLIISGLSFFTMRSFRSSGDGFRYVCTSSKSKKLSDSICNGVVSTPNRRGVPGERLRGKRAYARAGRYGILYGKSYFQTHSLCLGRK